MHAIDIMKRLILAALFIAGCASSNQSSGPDVQLALVQQGLSPDIYYFSGPISLQYQLLVTNPTNQPITLKRLDLQTEGQGAYYVRTSGTMNLLIPPNSTTTRDIYVWGSSRGGYLTAGEPVTMRMSAIFDDGSGKAFAKIAIQNLRQP